MDAALDGGRLQTGRSTTWRNVLEDPENPISSFESSFNVRLQPDAPTGHCTELPDEILEALSALLQPDAPADDSNAPIRIGDGVPPPRKIHDVPPVYPPGGAGGRCSRAS